MSWNVQKNGYSTTDIPLQPYEIRAPMHLQMILCHILDLEPSPRPHAFDAHIFLSAIHRPSISGVYQRVAGRTYSSRILIIGSPPGSIGFRKMTFCFYSAATILAGFSKREG